MSKRSWDHFKRKYQRKSELIFSCFQKRPKMGPWHEKSRYIFDFWTYFFFIFRIRVQMILSFLLHYSKSNLEAIWRNEKGLKMLHFFKNKLIFTWFEHVDSCWFSIFQSHHQFINDSKSNEKYCFFIIFFVF